MLQHINYADAHQLTLNLNTLALKATSLCDSCRTRITFGIQATMHGGISEMLGESRRFSESREPSKLHPSSCSLPILTVTRAELIEPDQLHANLRPSIAHFISLQQTRPFQRSPIIHQGTAPARFILFHYRIVHAVFQKYLKKSLENVKNVTKNVKKRFLHQWFTSWMPFMKSTKSTVEK